MNEIHSDKPQNISTPDSNKLSKRSKIEKFVNVFFVLLLIVSIAIATFYYYKYQTIKNNPAYITETEIKKLSDIVAKLIKLPADEEPTIATVEDKDKLRDQPFFADTENGDKILIYTKAKKAIIYRPNSNSIINVGPIVISN